MKDNKPSNVSSRIEMFQSKNALNNKPSKQKKKSNKLSTTNNLKNMFEKKINKDKISSTKKKKTVPKNKPTKKWKVKGIDVPHDKPDTEPIKSVSNSLETTVINRRTTDSLSLKERLNQYNEDVDSFDDRQRQRIDAHKQNRSGYDGIQVYCIHHTNQSVFLTCLLTIDIYGTETKSKRFAKKTLRKAKTNIINIK